VPLQCLATSRAPAIDCLTGSPADGLAHDSLARLFRPNPDTGVMHIPGTLLTAWPTLSDLTISATAPRALSQRTSGRPTSKMCTYTVLTLRDPKRKPTASSMLAALGRLAARCNGAVLTRITAPWLTCMLPVSA
jgi:hypothetical protein